ncbi:MAG: hypothetical protein KatS3mg119_0556 [Rhodothalassiaceae bacterium]|nr:MAG: hypothetical protein KatS3mg119_0556 [Rhodothalassiaceae bacterium]
MACGRKDEALPAGGLAVVLRRGRKGLRRRRMGVMRMAGVAALAVLLLSVPRQAVEAQADDGLKEVTAAALWQAAGQSRDRQAIARLLQQAIRGAGNSCAWVSDYQIVERTDSRLLFKAKCPGMPLYGVRITRGEGLELTVVGGDGLVGAFSAADGEIVSFDHPPSAGIFSAPPAEREERTAGEPAPVLLLGAALNILLLVLFVAAVVAAVLVIRRAQPLPPMDSATKNRLMLQAREVLPNVYRHPDGFYIVRGRHGRRRIFPWLVCALLYRDLGFRVLEHRALRFSGLPGDAE